MKTIVCCGKKQTGKSSAAKFLTGLILKNEGILEGFSQNSEGDLLVQTEDGWAILDIYRKDPEFVTWASQVIWPHIKIFSFAEELKLIIHRLFDIPMEHLLNGKDEKVKIRFNKIKKFIPKKYLEEYKDLKPGSYITVRQLLVIFGTYICREIDPECWVRRVFQDIKTMDPEIAIIDDCRFENEYLYSKKEKCDLILFESNDKPDNNPSESFEFPKKEFGLVLSKNENTMTEKNEKIKQFLLESGTLKVSV